MSEGGKHLPILRPTLQTCPHSQHADPPQLLTVTQAVASITKTSSPPILHLPKSYPSFKVSGKTSSISVETAL